MSDIRQSIETGNIDTGGGDINLNPVINAGLSEPQQEWRQALLRGPITALGLETSLERARVKQKDGEPGEAAAEIAQIATQLEDAGYPAVADDLRLEAAGQLLDQDPGKAHEQMLAVAQRQIDRADFSVDPLLMHLAHQASTLPADLTELLQAINNAVCPDDEQVVAACVACEGRSDEAWWRARLTELALMEEHPELALRVAEPIRSSTPSDQDRLLLELDALAAAEMMEGASATEDGWNQLLAWADEASRRPEDRGLIYQRRGTALAYRDDLASARASYVHAARAWSERSDDQEQAATALFSSNRASFLLGGPLDRGEDLAVAANLRGRIQSAAATADRLTLVGLHRLVDGKLRAALLRMHRAWRIAHRSGDLRGLHESFHILSRIWEAIADDEAGDQDDRARALAWSIRAGEHQRATRLAAQGDFGDLAGVLRLDAPRWERAASYAALARGGREVPEPAYSSAAARALAEGETTLGSAFGNDVVRLARHAAAACVFVEDEAVRERIIALMVRSSREGTYDDMEKALVALRQAQETGLGDHREVLLQNYLSDVPTKAVSVDNAQELFDDPISQNALRESARNDRRLALETLAIGGAIDDPALVQTCEDVVRDVLELETHAEARLDWISLSSEGIFGRVVNHALRRQFAAKLGCLASDVTDSRANRMQALGALFTLASALDASVAVDAFDAVAPIAAGDAPASTWDEDADASRHPLQMMRRFEPQRDQMVALAVRTTGELAHAAADRAEELQDIVDAALHTSSSVVQAAAVEVLASHHALRTPNHLARSDEPRLLAAQLRLQIARKGMPSIAELEEVFVSPHFTVRTTLLQAASASSAHRDVLGRLTQDRDAYLRAVARRRLEELELPVSSQ